MSTPARIVLLIGITGLVLAGCGENPIKTTTAPATVPSTSSGTGTQPEIGAMWVELLAGSPEYQKLAGPELVLVGQIAISGVAPDGRPEEVKWGWHLTVVNPWLPVADLRDCRNALDKLRAQRTLAEFGQPKVLIKAKLKRDRSMGKYPVVIPGWIRELQSGEPDWAMPWQVNLPLLPLEREFFPIPLIVACQSVTAADSRLGYSGVYHATQQFRVLELIHGKANVDQVLYVSYSYLDGQGRAVNEGERVIWVFTGDDHAMRGYGAVPDTPHNRDEARNLAARVKAMPVPTRRDLNDLDFTNAQVATNVEREVPTLFIEVPLQSGKWELRKEVKVVYSGPDGAVYFVPQDKVFFIRRDTYDARGSKTQSFFGSFQNDRSLLTQP